MDGVSSSNRQEEIYPGFQADQAVQLWIDQPLSVEDFAAYYLNGYNVHALSNEDIAGRAKVAGDILASLPSNGEVAELEPVAVVSDYLTDLAHELAEGGVDLFKYLHVASRVFEVDMGWRLGPAPIQRKACDKESFCPHEKCDCRLDWDGCRRVLEVADMLHFCFYWGGDVNSAVFCTHDNFCAEADGL